MLFVHPDEVRIVFAQDEKEDVPNRQTDQQTYGHHGFDRMQGKREHDQKNQQPGECQDGKREQKENYGGNSSCSFHRQPPSDCKNYKAERDQEEKKHVENWIAVVADSAENSSEQVNYKSDQRANENDSRNNPRDRKPFHSVKIVFHRRIPLAKNLTEKRAERGPCAAPHMFPTV